MPNLRIMEYEEDDVPWQRELVTHPPRIDQGDLVLSDRPGWGADVDEETVRAHPPRT